MEIKDLSIGNYLQLNTPSRDIVKVVEVNYELKRIKYEGVFGIQENNLPDPDILPIPLSDKWLIDFEFYIQKVIGNKIFWSHKKNLDLQLIQEGDSFYFSVNGIKSPIYVHELQHYFSLLSENGQEKLYRRMI